MPTPEADNQAVFKELIREICDSGVWRGEFYNRRKDGSTFYTAAHLSALKLNGKKLYIAVEEDITERKRGDGSLTGKRRALPQPVSEQPRGHAAD